jgi:RNA polymerase sigma-70 factor (ECF subfamily)
VEGQDTQALVASAKNGDDAARGMLLERIRPRLVLWCASSLPPALRSLYDADDVAQEILLAVHSGLGGFRGSDTRSFHAWIFRMGENHIRDLLDYTGAKKRQLPQAATFSQTSPSGAVMRAESAERVRRAVEALPEDYRAVIRMRRMEELEVPEIASRLGRSENAVRILYCRAIRALRTELGDEP